MKRIGLSFVLSFMLLFFSTPVPIVHAANANPPASLSSATVNDPSAYHVTALAVGGNHMCALTPDGEVKCWGDNSKGQLGNNSIIGSSLPVTVSGLSGVIAIGAGNSYTCALMTDGGVKCWGDNGYGQLGNGSLSGSKIPVSVIGLGSGVKAIAIAVGYNHTCALITGGLVKCWGLNDYGQLGDNTILNRTVPVDVIGLSSGVVSIAAGSKHTCAQTSDGRVKCWGLNVYGQLGNNSKENSPLPVDVSGLSAVMGIAAGDNHTCAWVAGGVKCWGMNGFSQLGNGTMNDSLVPVDVTALGGEVIGLSAGLSHTCVWMAGGGVKCWGWNNNGQLGNNSTTDSPVPVEVSGLSAGIHAVAAGGRQSCALMTDGSARCWGDNSKGQLGDGTTITKKVPVSVIGLSRLKMISAGNGHTCILTVSGEVKCWGDNSYGQLGNGSGGYFPNPVDVIGLSNVTMIAAGGQHTCAVITGGMVKCWGRNNHGQLGNNSTIDSFFPVNVTGLTSITAIAAGSFHTCALSTSGGVKCWGENSSGQLGNNSTTSSLAPVNVLGLSSGVTAIATGGAHSCALISAGPRCWGNNQNGQLGNNSTINSAIPVSVSNLASATTIVTGGAHSCALTANGQSFCWGANDRGQLGNGTLVNSSIPVSVLTGVTAITGGDAHTCALTADGAKCWGYNAQGQLGNGSTLLSLFPVNVSGLTGVNAVAAGGWHTCAIIAGGGVRCWGDNHSGQLGNGSLIESHTHGPVIGLLPSAIPIVHLFANPAEAGQPISITATLFGVLGEPGGNVQFRIDGEDFGSPVTLVGGSATSNVLSDLAVGPHGVTAIYSGDGNYRSSQSAGVVQSVKISTNANLASLTLSSGTLEPAFAPATTSYTASVAGASITVTPTAANPHATIQVNEVAVDSGSASNNIPLNVGQNTISIVVFAQDGVTTKTYTVSVFRRADSSVTLAASSNPSSFNQPVTFTAFVTSTTSGIPTGTVQISVDGTAVGSPVPLQPSGIASLDIATLSVGEHTITAAYSGDGKYNGSTSSGFRQVVNKAIATLTFSGLNPLYDGFAQSVGVTTDPAGLKISLTYNGSSSAPTDAGSYAVVATVDDPNYQGTASDMLFIAARNLSVSAVAANKVYDGSTTAAVTLSDDRIAGDLLTVTQESAAFADQHVGSSKTVSVSGLALSGMDAGNYTLSKTSVTATADITPLAIVVTAVQDNKTYDGTIVSAMIPTMTSGALVEGDSANWTQTFDTPQVGTEKTLTPSGRVIDGNDGNNYTVTLNLVHTGAIQPAPLIIQAEDETIVFGEPLPLFQATYSGFVNGENDDVLGGSLIFETSVPQSLAVGTYSITPKGSTSANYAITFHPGILTIGKANTRSSVQPSASSVTAGQVVTFIVLVSPAAPGEGVPTGKITLMDGAMPLGTYTLSDGKVTFAISNLAAGAHSLSTRYAGDGNFNASSSDEIQIVVSPLEEQINSWVFLPVLLR